MQPRSYELSGDRLDFGTPDYLQTVMVQPSDLRPNYDDVDPATFAAQYYQDDSWITGAALPLHPLLGTPAVDEVYKLLLPFEKSVREFKSGELLTELGTSKDPAIHLVLEGRSRLVATRSVGKQERRWVVAQYGPGQWIGLPQLLRESDRGTEREWPDAGVELQVEALVPVRTQRIALGDARALLGSVPDFRRFVEHNVAVRFARRREMLRRLADNPLLRLLSPVSHDYILQLGAIVSDVDKPPYIPAGPPAGRVALLLRGEASLLLPGDSAASVRYGATFRPGDLMGHEALVMNAEWRDPEATNVTLLEPPRTTEVRLAPNAQVLQFYWYALRWVLDNRAAVWQRVKRILSGAPAALAERMPTVVSFHGARPGLGTTVLACGTGAALASVGQAVEVIDVQGQTNFDRQWKARGFTFEDRTLPLQAGPRVARATGRPTTFACRALVPPTSAGWPPGLEIVWPADPDPERTEDLVDVLETVEGLRHIIVAGRGDETGELMGRVSDRLHGRCSAVFYVCDAADTPYPGVEPENLIWVYRMTPGYLASEQSHAGRVRFDWLFAGAINAAPDAWQQAIEKMLGYSPNAELERESLLGLRRAVRIPEDRDGADTYDRDGPAALVAPGAQQAFPLARAFARLGRVTDRRSVGLALGGGGAWGFSHVALLRNLEAQGVPIDYIAGTSFGSVVGGLYAAGGMRALDVLVNENSATGTGVGPTLRALVTGNLNRALLAAPFSTAAVEMFVNAALRAAGSTCPGDPPCLGATEIPFYPVGTNLGTHMPLALPHATVGWGVRMSGSLPPMYRSLPRGYDRIADGAFIANVPSRVLREVGAHFVIAANVVPPPTERIPRSLGNSIVTWLPRKILERFEDGVRGLFVLAWKAGEDQGALAADLSLDLRPTAGNLFEMWRGRDIVDQVHGDHFKDKNAPRIRDAWKSFRSTPSSDS